MDENLFNWTVSSLKIKAKFRKYFASNMFEFEAFKKEMRQKIENRIETASY